jgi:2-polyprenyl-3-methyl-5-hydroxy-6-metoxy-1,4-benzoquinol methylase
MTCNLISVGLDNNNKVMASQPIVEIVPCNLCETQDSEKLFSKGGLDIARCRQCGLVYANPRLAQQEIWKRYSPDYFWQEYMPAHHAANGEYGAEWHRHRAQPILNLLQPYRKVGTLLEVGCAAGFFLKVAEENGWTVQGVEIMAPAVEYARTSLGLNVFEGTLEQAQLAADSFDVVVMIETVEHLLDPAQALGEAYRVLRTGGIIWVAVPNLNSIMRSLMGVDWSVLSPAEHLYYFTVETLEKMLRKAGFQSVEFIWQVGLQTIWETMNPLNTHHSHSLRSRVVKWATLSLGRWAVPFTVHSRRTDRLIALAAK